MLLQRLSLINFRNYERAEIELSPHLNLISGLNAQGKTNLLEAIYLLCLGKSFRLAKNQELVKYGTKFFTIEAELILDSRIQKKAIVNYVRDAQKQISIDKKKLKGHAQIFGQFPIVIMSPDEFRITSGGPAERRRFIDILISQISRSYLSDLQEYKRILRQRNHLLHALRDHGGPQDESTVEPWTQSLIRTGSRIIRTRHEFLRDFSVTLRENYRKLTGSDDSLEVFLDSKIGYSSVDKIESAFTVRIRQVSSNEKILATTLVGPHRDDLVFRINGFDLRKYGSRGEHKSVLISIKIAELRFIEDRIEETPLLLLDDCYSELDKFREQKVLDSLSGPGQIFLTSPREEESAMRLDFLRKFTEISHFSVSGGQIQIHED